ncbi:hypothetical protein CCP3SC15_2140005 [Gammaproteobacteria bacterium]
MQFNTGHPRLGWLSRNLLDPSRSEARTLFILGTLLVVGATTLLIKLPAGVLGYAQSYPPVLLSAEAWWTEHWHDLPALRNNLINRPRQPLDLQWAGPLEPLQARLAAAGWKTHPALSSASLLRLLAPDPSATELPLVPQFLDGRPDTLRLVLAPSSPRGDGREKAEGNSVPNEASQWRIIRLWASGVHLTPGDTPLWVGYVNCLEPWRPIPWVTILRTGTCSGMAREILANPLTDLDLRTVRRESSHGFAGEGTVLLVRSKTINQQ